MHTWYMGFGCTLFQGQVWRTTQASVPITGQVLGWKLCWRYFVFILTPIRHYFRGLIDLMRFIYNSQNSNSISPVANIDQMERVLFCWRSGLLGECPVSSPCSHVHRSRSLMRWVSWPIDCPIEINLFHAWLFSYLLNYGIVINFSRRIFIIIPSLCVTILCVSCVLLVCYLCVTCEIY